MSYQVYSPGAANGLHQTPGAQQSQSQSQSQQAQSQAQAHQQVSQSQQQIAHSPTSATLLHQQPHNSHPHSHLLHTHSSPNVLGGSAGPAPTGGRKRTNADDLYYLTSRQGIEPNVSYTRGYNNNNNNNSNHNTPNGAGAGTTPSGGSTPLVSEPLLAARPIAKASAPSSGGNYQHQNPRHSHARKISVGSESDEDERFLRLAKEALVATAGAKGNGTEDLMVDPTIQDLLRRLQYAASPHGNPIKRSKKIRANENGQLQIQGFYKNFPNLSNNIFMESEGAGIVNSQASSTLGEGSSSGSAAARGSNGSATVIDKSVNHPSNSRNDGWNFLIGAPMVYKTSHEGNGADSSAVAAPAAAPGGSGIHNSGLGHRNPGGSGAGPGSKSILDDDDADKNNDDSEEGSSGETRKFACSKCMMSFRRSSDLKRHEKQHLTIPPNICELCGKGFARKDALKRHMGTLTCKRNADKRLYTDNLGYLGQKTNGGPTGAASSSAAKSALPRASSFQTNETNDWSI